MSPRSWRSSKTLLYGVRNRDCPEDQMSYGACADTRYSEMPGYGVLGFPEEQLNDLTEWVVDLAGGDADPAAVARAEPLAPLCAECHGDDSYGYVPYGGPNLRDDIWLYGSDRDIVYDVIANGRLGVCPPWADTLDAATIKSLAVYIWNTSFGALTCGSEFPPSGRQPLAELHRGGRRATCVAVRCPKRYWRSRNSLTWSFEIAGDRLHGIDHAVVDGGQVGPFLPGQVRRVDHLREAFQVLFARRHEGSNRRLVVDHLVHGRRGGVDNGRASGGTQLIHQVGQAGEGELGGLAFHRFRNQFEVGIQGLCESGDDRRRRRAGIAPVRPRRRSHRSPRWQPGSR